MYINDEGKDHTGKVVRKVKKPMTIEDAIGLGVDALCRTHWGFKTEMDEENGFKHNFVRSEKCLCQCGEAIRVLNSVKKCSKMDRDVLGQLFTKS